MHRLPLTFGIACCLLFFVWITMSIWHHHRTEAARLDARGDLQTLMTAMHQYHDEHGVFPPAYVRGTDGQRWHSWRALLLPHLDPDLAARYRLEEPWDGPHNSQLAQSTPDCFQSMNASGEDSATSYFAVVGPRTLWPAWQSISMSDVTDGTTNTIALVEDERTDICWLEPRDLRFDELLQTWETADRLNDGSGRTAGMADGTVQFFKRVIDRALLTSLLTPSYHGRTFQGDDWPADLSPPVPSQQTATPQSSDRLEMTEVRASPKQPMDTTRNQVWCATFQQAWDRNPVSVPAIHDTIRLLNEATLRGESLSPESCFVATTDGSQTADTRLTADLRRHFPDVSVSLHDVDSSSPVKLRLYSLLRKQMPFETVFDRFQTALSFSYSGTPVNSFGLDPATERASLRGFQGQVDIVDDRGDDDCVIRLQTVGPQRDQIILAMTSPKATLLQTWESVRDRVENPNPQHQRPSFEDNETLQVPILDFSLKHHFAELEGVSWQDPSGLDFEIRVAFQEIHLRLDETGADLMSAGEMFIVGEFGGDEFDPNRVRRFIFNRPFFIAMKEQTAEKPYLLAWIANAELAEAFTHNGGSP